MIITGWFCICFCWRSCYGKPWFAPQYFSILVGIAQLIAALGAMFGEVPLALSIDAIGWQNAIVNLAIIGMVLTLLIAITIQNNKKPVHAPLQQQSLLNDVLTILKNKQNWVIALYAFACWGPVTSFAELWGVEFLRQNLTISYIAASVQQCMALYVRALLLAC